MNNIPSKNALILCKKIHPLFHLAHSKYPYILLKYPSKKWGMWVVTVGVFTVLVLFHGAGTREKKSSQWNNQFSMGVFHVHSIQYSIDLISICLKIVRCPTYITVETRYPTPRYPISMFYQGVYFCHTMALVAAGSYRCHPHSSAQSKRKYLI